MKSLHRAIAAASLMLVCVSPLGASASTRQLWLSAGNMVTSRMNKTIDSGSAHSGDTFSLTLMAPYPANDAVYTNAQLYGHVTRVTAAGQGRDPVLEFVITRIVLANGRESGVSMLLQSQETQRHNNLGNIALTTAGGMIIGNMIGKSVLKTNLGGAVGLIAGALYANNRKSDVSLRQGSVVVTEVRQTVALLYPRTTVGAMRHIR